MICRLDYLGEFVHWVGGGGFEVVVVDLGVVDGFGDSGEEEE